MRELEKVLKSAANQKRLAILSCLKRSGEMNVGDIAAAIKLSFKATSKHLGVLANASVVESDKRALLVFYRLAPLKQKWLRQLISQL